MQRGHRKCHRNAEPTEPTGSFPTEQAARLEHAPDTQNIHGHMDGNFQSRMEKGGAFGSYHFSGFLCCTSLIMGTNHMGTVSAPGIRVSFLTMLSGDLGVILPIVKQSKLW